MLQFLARHLRALADRLSSEPELDALRLQCRAQQIELDFLRRKFKDECAYVERLLRERDAARNEAGFWLRTAGDQSEVIICQAEAAFGCPSSLSARPVFGRRTPVPHLRPVD